MANIVTLTCPSCGGQLEITTDIERFACGYCGNEHVVRRSGGIVTIDPIVDGLKQVRNGVDKTASELAIKRLNQEITEIGYSIQKLYGRLISKSYAKVGLFSTLYETIRDGQRRPRFIDDIDVVAISALEKMTLSEIEELISIYEKSLPFSSSMLRAIFSPNLEKKTERTLSTLKKLFSLRKLLKEKNEEMRRHQNIVNE